MIESPTPAPWADDATSMSVALKVLEGRTNQNAATSRTIIGHDRYARMPCVVGARRWAFLKVAHDSIEECSRDHLHRLVASYEASEKRTHSVIRARKEPANGVLS